jgi:AcrR family transcriptional regulator
MKQDRTQARRTEICDTVAHISDATAASSARDPRAAKSDLALRGALLSLLETRSFNQITVREICAEAGVHYATFFRHHQTKEALLDHVAADEIDHLVSLTLPVLDTVDSLAAAVATCAYVDEHRALWTALLTGGAAGTMRKKLLTNSQRVAAERAHKDGWLPVDLAIICTVSLMVETLSWWLMQPKDAMSVEAVATILDRLMMASTTEGSMKR